MKFTIKREALLRPLQVVSGVVEKRQTLPVLSNVLVQAESDRLVLTGTDLEVELTASAPLEGADVGEVTLTARKFLDICRTLPEGAELAVAVDGERANVRSGKSRFHLATLPATEYPTSDPVQGAFRFEVAQGALRELIDRTQFCMANQDVRYYLNGLLLEVDAGRLRTVATDGHRLAVSDLVDSFGVEEQRQVIVPRKGVLELAKLLEESDAACTVQLTSNHIRVEVGEVTMVSKLIDGRFPDYERVIPPVGDKTVKADRSSLRQALVRASILSNEKYRGVRVQLEENRLRATVSNPEQEEAEEDIDVDYMGAAFEIGFNVAYLLDALNAVKQEEVIISLTDANSSCLIHGSGDESSRYVVMPMRL